MKFFIKMIIVLNNIFVLEKTLPYISKILDFFLGNKIYEELSIGDNDA